jgi:selenocysteine-specific elongation factor
VGAETAPNLCLGTAGHVDHGKTWLVKALTGKDTDRLPEEQRRGISIDLGYAPLDLPDGRRLSLIDVPGHERFVRNMVAGATGIDLFLLVVDAGEGPRPQTHEHLAILRLLGVEHGVIALTKSDAVGANTLAARREEARALEPAAEVVAVSAKTGGGLDDLRAALARAADRVERKRSHRPTRLYVDRVFTLRGIGTIATGTLWSGLVGSGDELRTEPRGRTVRVRSVEVHDQPVDRAAAGQRVALSLPGVETTDLERGDALVAPGAYPVSYRLDVALDELEPIADGARVAVHHGTSEVPARVVRAGTRYAQLRLARPVVAARGDRFVLRSATTVGGGRVLDPAPPRNVDEARLELLDTDDAKAIVQALVDEPTGVADLARRALLDDDELAAGLESLERAGDWVFSRRWLDETRARVHERLAAAPRLDPGIAVGELLPAALAPELVPRLGVEQRGGKLYLPGTAPSLGDRAQAANALLAELEAVGAQGTKVEDGELARYLEAEGRLVRLREGVAVSRATYEHARDVLVAECEDAGRITLARFRDLLGISRRPAQLLLERFDADGLTRRVGDERVLRRAALQRYAAD